MIYSFLKQIIRITLFFFFKKIVVTGKEDIPTEGPVILVANHPNTFMDPFLIAAITKQRIGFVANAGIFVNKFVSAIFNYFHVIPVFRKQDIKPGEKPDNRKSFMKCHEYLARAGTLLIFPEGTSYYELKLREIKTGTARIALSYAELNKFEGNLKIVPIALDYSDSIQFRSVVSVTVCPALSIDDYRSAFEANEYDAVDQVTEDIRKSLADIVPQTSSKEQEEFLVKAHQFYATFDPDTKDKDRDAKKYLHLRNQVSKALRYIQQENLVLYQSTQTKLLEFFKLLREERITPAIVSSQLNNKQRRINSAKYFLTFLLLFPVYVLGLLANYIPYMLTAKIFKILGLDISYRAPVQMITGLITFPLFYAMIIGLFRMYISDVTWHSLLLLILLPISGYIALYYYAEIKRFKRLIHFNYAMNDAKRQEIQNLYDKISQNMEKARQKYIQGI